MPNQASQADGTVESIPGLGPIRARALKKAGFENLTQLREASIEQMAAVPGITEIKARQLAAFFRGETDTRRAGEAAPAPRRAASPRAKQPRQAGPAPKPAPPVAEIRTPRPPSLPRVAPAAPVARPIVPKLPAPPPVAPSILTAVETPVAASARRIAVSANALLRTTSADSYERAFARQIGKIAALAERITLEAGSSPAGLERVSGQMRKIELLLAEIGDAGKLGAKRQDRFTEEMRERRHKLLEGFDSADIPPPATPKRLGNDKGNKGHKDGKNGRRDRSG